MSAKFIATAGLEMAPLQDGAVLYNLKTSKFIMLNRPAAFLWTELSTPKTEDELTGGLCVNFSGISAPAAKLGVSEVLENLKQLELVSKTEAGDAGVSTSETRSKTEAGKELMAYEHPSVRVLNEEELLNIFQMTAAEISVASCWWGSCATAGCP